MPQPESSRNVPWSDANRPWPLAPEAPRPHGDKLGGRGGKRPPEEPEKDGRTPTDPDGNEELEREVREDAPVRRSAGERASAHDAEHEQTGEWQATRFEEAELEDTWPYVPARFFDD